jgi:surface carbohydrate biosynthesis protein
VKYPVVYITLEIASRELNSKLLLANKLAENGFYVIIGSKFFVRRLSKINPKGLIIEKSLSPENEILYSKLVSNKHKICAFDEEGLVYYDTNDYISRRISIENLKKLEYYFSWGSRNTSDISNFAGKKLSKKIIDSGHPRMEILSNKNRSLFMDEVDCIKKEVGKFILVNSRFGIVNGRFKNTDEIITYYKKLKKIKNLTHENYWRKYINLSREISREFSFAVKFLAKSIPEVNIVFRPHPSESIDFWESEFDIYPNIIVSRIGDVNNWIIASEVMIHNNCTTSIESTMLSKPCISFRPIKDESVESEILDSISIKVSTQKGLLRQVKAILSDEEVNSNNKVDDNFQGVLLNKLIYNPIKTSSKIIDAIKSLKLKNYYTFNLKLYFLMMKVTLFFYEILFRKPMNPKMGILGRQSIIRKSNIQAHIDKVDESNIRLICKNTFLIYK